MTVAMSVTLFMTASLSVSMPMSMFSMDIEIQHGQEHAAWT
jgi:hypothetical protein